MARQDYFNARDILQTDGGSVTIYRLDALEKAYQDFKAETARPTLIMADSHIAYGSPNKQDSSDAHGAPLGEEEIKLTKKFYGWPEDAQFLVPDGVREHFDTGIGRRGGRRPAPCPRGCGAPPPPASGPSPRPPPRPSPRRYRWNRRFSCGSGWCARPPWRRRWRRAAVRSAMRAGR